MNDWPAVPDWAGPTTSRCNDINVKPNVSTHVAVCYSEEWCDTPGIWISANTWGTPDTNVPDGEYFYLDFDRPSSGLAAYRSDAVITWGPGA
ncbi:hypothetical protein [Streptomyces sp. NPDC001970]